MFQFPAFASYIRIIRLQRIGLPHSEIVGLKAICTYPTLIAAYHVLLRLREPRHSPFALIFFFIISPINRKLLLTNCNTQFTSILLVLLQLIRYFTITNQSK